MSYFLAILAVVLHCGSVLLAAVSGMFIEETNRKEAGAEKSKCRRNAQGSLGLALIVMGLGVATAVLAGGLWR